MMVHMTVDASVHRLAAKFRTAAFTLLALPGISPLAASCREYMTAWDNRTRHQSARAAVAGGAWMEECPK
jgi:hypothetical protein